MNCMQDLEGLQRRDGGLRPLGMLDLKGGRQSLKKIYILYTFYAALGGGGRVSSHFLLGLPHPCRFTFLAGSTCWSWLSSSVEGGQVNKSSPRLHWPEVRGLGTVTL